MLGWVCVVTLVCRILKTIYKAINADHVHIVHLNSSQIQYDLWWTFNRFDWYDHTCQVTLDISGLPEISRVTWQVWDFYHWAQSVVSVPGFRPAPWPLPEPCVVYFRRPSWALGASLVQSSGSLQGAVMFPVDWLLTCPYMVIGQLA